MIIVNIIMLIVSVKTLGELSNIFDRRFKYELTRKLSLRKLIRHKFYRTKQTVHTKEFVTTSQALDNNEGLYKPQNFRQNRFISYHL